jgi:hypothetical protein
MVIAVEVRGRRCRPGWCRPRTGKRGRARHSRFRAGARPCCRSDGRDDVEVAVAVKITEREVANLAARGVSARRTERSVAVAEQDVDLVAVVRCRDEVQGVAGVEFSHWMERVVPLPTSYSTGA